jgi:hypothetical protein
MPLALNQRRPLIDDPRQAAVERAVKIKALAQLAREIGIDEALMVISTAMDATPRELAAAGRRAHRERVVSEIVRIEMDGRGRAAVSIVARMYAADVRDPIEFQSLTRKFRSWRSAEKRIPIRLPSRKSIRE